MLRQTKLRSLAGSADFEEVSAATAAVETAKEKEAAARQVLAFLGGDVRVSMPQPLGKPLSQVASDEKNMDEAIIRRQEEAQRRAQEGNSGKDSGDDAVGGSGSGSGSGSGGYWESVDADLVNTLSLPQET